MIRKLDNRKLIRKLLLAVSMLAVPASTMAGPECTAEVGHACIVVTTIEAQVTINRSALLDPVEEAVEVSAWTVPTHGVLLPELANDDFGSLTYQPHPTFWSVGIDSFLYRVERADGTSVNATFLVVAAGYQNRFYRVSFDKTFGQEGLAADGATGWLIRTPEAALEGELGLSVAAGSDDAWVIADLTNSPFLGIYEGGTQEGKNTTVGICPPDGASGGGFGEDYGGVDGIVVLAGGADTTTYFEVRLRSGAANQAELLPVYLDTATTSDFGAWLPVAAEPQLINVDWYTDTIAGMTSFQLNLDGEFVGAASGPVGDKRDLEWLRLGRMGTPASGAPEVMFDSFEVDGSGPGHGWVPVVVENFEDGTLDRWSTTALSYLDITDPPGLGSDPGDKSRQLEVELRMPRYLEDTLPVAADRFNLRFRVDRGVASLPASTKITVAAAYDQQARRHFGVFLVSDSVGELHLRVGARANMNESWQYIPKIPFPAAGTAMVDVAWRRSFDATATGRLDFWIDGVHAGVLTGLSSNSRTVASYRVGAITLDPGIDGHFYLDDVLAWVPLTPSP